jgi:hypothetical protein
VHASSHCLTLTVGHVPSTQTLQTRVDRCGCEHGSWCVMYPRSSLDSPGRSTSASVCGSHPGCWAGAAVEVRAGGGVPDKALGQRLAHHTSAEEAHFGTGGGRGGHRDGEVAVALYGYTCGTRREQMTWEGESVEAQCRRGTVHATVRSLASTRRRVHQRDAADQSIGTSGSIHQWARGGGGRRAGEWELVGSPRWSTLLPGCRRRCRCTR